MKVLEHLAHLLGTLEYLREVFGRDLGESGELLGLVGVEVSIRGESKGSSSHSIILRSAGSSSKLLRFKLLVSGSVLILTEICGGMSLEFCKFFWLIEKLGGFKVLFPVLNRSSCPLTKK